MDENDFRELTDRYRRELHVHCYRMLGSVQDAEDVLQETLLAAWRGFDRFEERASVRAWLYKIATNRCLNFKRDAKRRPRVAEWPAQPPDPTGRIEATWLEPYPDSLLEDAAAGPEARYEQRESIALAFVTGLQHLPSRQRATLVMRDVLGLRAAEVAEMLETSEASVNSALQRARAALAARSAVRERAPLPDSPQEREVVSRFADLFERGDIEGVVAMLTDDALLTMPPQPLEYEGREAIAEFFRIVPAALGFDRFRFTATRANGQPALLYERGIIVLELAGERISGITRFPLEPESAFRAA
jgi:RNA polymerase sigma-70 factor (ECF subfamily)